VGVVVGEELTAQTAPRTAEDSAPPRPRTALCHVNGRHFDHELGCLVSRGLGFSWRCTCGARGRISGDRAAALEAKREHEEGHARP
jgi:hypothetical protein